MLATTLVDYFKGLVGGDVDKPLTARDDLVGKKTDASMRPPPMSINQPLPPCPKCGSECRIQIGNKKHCNQCGESSNE